MDTRIHATSIPLGPVPLADALAHTPGAGPSHAPAAGALEITPYAPGAAPGDAGPEPADRRGRFTDVCIVLIALVLVLGFLKYAEAFAIPVVVGLIISYTLRPLVDLLARRLAIPRPIGAAVLLIAISAGVVAGAWNLRDDAASFAAELPEAARKMRNIVRESAAGPPGIVGNLQRAATELDQAAVEAAGTPRAAVKPPAATRPTIAESAQAFLTAQLAKLMGIGGTLGIASLLAYLLLCAGNEFRRKLLRIVGGTLAKKKITISILDEIHTQVQRYLLGMALSNVVLGVATWALFAYVGVEHAALWGVIAGVLHLVPYAGTAVFIVITYLLGLIHLESLMEAFYLASAWTAAQLIIGFGLSTWIQSRSAGINGVALFAGLLFFGWLWGGWGLIVSVPVMATVKAVADRVPELEAVSTALS